MNLERGSFSRFAVVGCTNFVVSFAAFALAYYVLDGFVFASAANATARHGSFPWSNPAAGLSNLFAYAAGMLNSFILNKFWTFAARRNSMSQARRFAVINLISVTVSSTAIYLLVDVLRLHHYAIWTAVTFVLLLFNYHSSRYWVFADPRERGCDEHSGAAP